MITARKLAREVIRLESGGDKSKDSPLREPYVILLVRQALATFLKPLFYENLNDDDRSTLHMYIIGYEVTVEIDEPTQRKFFRLPDFFIHLPFNKGLHSVAPVDDPLNQFIPKHNPAVTFNLPAGDLQGQMGYWQEGRNVFLDNRCELDKLKVCLLQPAPDSIADDDPLPLYSEQQVPVIALVRQLLANQPIQDRLNDENKDLGTRIPV